MSTIPSYLEIYIYLTNGSIQKYHQLDQEIIKKIFTDTDPQKLFSQKTLTITGALSYRTYPCEAVERVDWVMENYPEWLTSNSQWDIREITEDEFKDSYKPQLDKSLVRDETQPVGDAHHGFTQFEFLSGRNLYLEVFGKVKPKMDRQYLTQQLLALNTLFYKRKEGGVIFINPTRIASMVFYPGPSFRPPYSWQAEPK